MPKFDRNALMSHGGKDGEFHCSLKSVTRLLRLSVGSADIFFLFYLGSEEPRDGKLAALTERFDGCMEVKKRLRQLNIIVSHMGIFYGLKDTRYQGGVW